ncbi:amino acid adenylation domain-containing protein [Paracoccus jiaweipingae]|uniref:amino acid adenylation domain-containing protein n=1 Tax=Paracoccus sp. p2-l61 TaxID=3366950 RepID=UPI0037BBE69B
MTDLTPMQAAYWSGRQSGGIAAHLYVELDGGGGQGQAGQAGQAPLDASRLADAVRRLMALHPMLRLRVTPAGRQMVTDFCPQRHGLVVEDLSAAGPQACVAALTATRDRMTHQALDLSRGIAAQFRLTLLPGGAHRLHVDLDMMAADPSCFGRLMDDLARLYADPHLAADHLQPCYLELLTPAAADAGDRAWWQRALADLPPPLDLPGPATCLPVPRSTSLSARLDAGARAALTRQARAAAVTPAMLSLALFARVMADQTGRDDFRLTVPGFLRPAQHPHGDRMVGDYAGISILAVRRARATGPGDLGRDLSRQLAAALSHGGWPGVSALRDLSRQRGRVEASPVVFTAGFGLPGGSILSGRARQVLGRLGWAVSQGPGVALDVQLAQEDDGLLLNWDLRLDLVDEGWARRAFTQHVQALRAPVADAAPALRAGETPLGDLRKAYLLGRGDALPLGGVAMQEFREYRGALTVAQITARLARLVAAHPALRCRIDPQAGTSWCGDTAPAPQIVDLRDLDPATAEVRIAAGRSAFAHHVDDLATSPWALRLYQMPQGSPDATVAQLRVDALILDGFGIARIARQLFGGDAVALPDAAPTDAPNPAALPVATTAARDAAERWWRDRLADAVVPPRLPWRQPPDQIVSSGYARRQVRLSAPDLARLRRIGARAGLTANSILSVLVLDSLARWTPDLSLCVALPVAPPDQGVLGNRAGFVALCHDAGDATLPERAARLQRNLAGALSHLAFSGVALTRMLLAGRDARIALPVVLTNGLGWDAPVAGAPMRWTGGLTQTPQVALDLRLSLDEAGDLIIAADYATEALEDQTVHDILAAMGQTMRAVAAADSLPAHLPPGDPEPAPEAQPGADADAGAEPLPYLAQIAARLDDPHSGTALIRNGQAVSYARLGRQVRALMAGLRDRGLGEGSVLAICLPRGRDHLALQLAAAFAGIIWVPIDAASPPRRLAYLLENCRAALVVGDVWATPGLPARAVTARQLEGDPGTVTLDPELLARRSHAEGAGYYLYTSGTTGLPKCVVLSNAATANVIGASLSRWRIGPDDVVMSVTPLHHDMSVFDLFGALTAGACIVMPDAGADKDAAHWAQLVAAHRVTVWVSVPAILDMLTSCASDAQIASLRLIAQGGDYIRPAAIDALRRRLPGCVLYALGGPTETTIWSIWHPIGPDDRSVIPYGRALPGNTYSILDPLGRPCPPGVTGRIHSAGRNLALGYLRQGGLVQDDFITPDQPGNRAARLFRSGDLGWRRRDGTIIFAGRVDGYVKVRGVRVSLPDIAGVLSDHPAISAGAVVDLPDPASGETVLGAAYVAGSGLAPGDLRAFLRSRLPASHLPSRMLALDRLPLSPNGKPDRAAMRAALARLDGAAAAPEAAPVVAADVADGGADSGLTALILQEFRAALAAADMTADDDFFDRGGHSLTATRIVGRLASRHRVRLRFEDIFAHPTARALARVAVVQDRPAPDVGLRVDGLPPDGARATAPVAAPVPVPVPAPGPAPVTPAGGHVANTAPATPDGAGISPAPTPHQPPAPCLPVPARTRCHGPHRCRWRRPRCGRSMPRWARAICSTSPLRCAFLTRWTRSALGRRSAIC